MNLSCHLVAHPTQNCSFLMEWEVASCKFECILNTEDIICTEILANNNWAVQLVIYKY